MLDKKSKAGNSLPQVFSYTDNPIHVEIFDSQPWFIAKDICEVLSIKETHRAVAGLDDDERQTLTGVDSRNRKNRMIFINESGLYSLIFRSNKPEAKAFRKWVTSEVLPNLRKEGNYSIAPPAHLPAYDVLKDFKGYVKQIKFQGSNYYHLAEVLRFIRVGSDASKTKKTMGAALIKLRYPGLAQEAYFIELNSLLHLLQYHAKKRNRVAAALFTALIAGVKENIKGLPSFQSFKNTLN